MKLTDEEQKRLEEVKRQISMEDQYNINNYQYPLVFDNKKNNFGFASIIPISIILIIVVILLIIIF